MHKDLPDELLRDLPPVLRADLVTTQTSGSWFKLALGALVALVLVLLLLGQAVYFFRADLYQYPQLRPQVLMICRLFEGRVCDRHELRAFRMIQSQVASHPLVGDALRVTGVLRNDATFPQPFPFLEMRFLNLQGALIAGRIFQPTEYLPEGYPAFVRLMPGKQVAFQFDIFDPGPESWSYHFEFY